MLGAWWDYTLAPSSVLGIGFVGRQYKNMIQGTGQGYFLGKVADHSKKMGFPSCCVKKKRRWLYTEYTELEQRQRWWARSRLIGGTHDRRHRP